MLNFTLAVNIISWYQLVYRYQISNNKLEIHIESSSSKGVR